MDLIRIFCDIKDIKIKSVVNHFLRYLAVYIEEIYDSNEELKNSALVDIYIISKNYSDVSIDIKNEKKAILILADGYDIDEKYGVKKILYDTCSSKVDFLKALVAKIQKVLAVRSKVEDRLIFDDFYVDEIVESYVKNSIFESSICARYFFENRDRLDWILNNYKEFINELTFLDEKSKSDLLTYVISYAMYEADVACKKHLCELVYSPDKIVENCNQLMKKYGDNIENCLLIADVHFELMDSWAKAANEYGNVNLMYCSYAHYKRGRILRKYANDIENALTSIKNALKLNKYYYNAWYQYAMCYDEKSDYAQEIYALEKICSILKEKKDEHILSPIEIEYFYKTILQMKQINEEMLFDLEYEDQFELERRRIISEAGEERYIKELDLKIPKKYIESKVLGDEFLEKMREFQKERCR